jgi:hypothetical protein
MTQPLAWHKKPAFTFPWLLGARADVLCLLAPSLIAVSIYLLFAGQPLWLDQYAPMLALTYAGNVVHQGGTWFHYLDRRNRKHYFGMAWGKFRYIGAPALIIALSGIVGMYSPHLVMIVYILWSLPHFVQQNVGILLLYHDYNSGEAVVDRKIEVRSQQFAGLFFSLCACHRMALEATPLAQASAAVTGIVFFCAVFSCGAYLAQLFSKVRKGAKLNVPALVFWFISVTYFLPLAYVGSDFGVSFMIPSLLHWIQYIGLNYILVKRKYEGARQAKYLVRRRDPVSLFIGFCLLLVIVQYGTYVLLMLHLPQKTFSVFDSMFLGIGMVHYLIDGLIWRFREPYNREAMLPYLRVRRP